MKTHTKILVGCAIVFILWAGVMQFRQIQDLRAKGIKPASERWVLTPDGKLITPPLSKAVPTGTDMMNCTSCKHRGIK